MHVKRGDYDIALAELNARTFFRSRPKRDGVVRCPGHDPGHCRSSNLNTEDELFSSRHQPPPMDEQFVTGHEPPLYVAAKAGGVGDEQAVAQTLSRPELR